MCLIIDANLAASVLGENSQVDFQPVLDWLTSPRKDGKLVVGGQLADELQRISAARRFVKSLEQAGRARRIPDGVTDAETARITGLCESNDPHVIALARISGARVLCSNDAALRRDFKDSQLVRDPPGHIYQKARHEHLLRKYGHTEACRKSIQKNWSAV